MLKLGTVQASRGSELSLRRPTERVPIYISYKYVGRACERSLVPCNFRCAELAALTLATLIQMGTLQAGMLFIHFSTVQVSVQLKTSVQSR